MRKSRLSLGLVVVVMAFVLASCFTGIESTPKITAKDVKKQNVVETKEAKLLEGIVAERPSEWKTGKEFYIADNRAARAAWRLRPTDLADSIAGRIAVLEGLETIPTLTGDSEIVVNLTVTDIEAMLQIRSGLSPKQWDEAETLTLPHIIDMTVVNETKSRLSGKKFYILPARRLGWNGSDTIGTRYQPVTVLDVLPATESAPLEVVFADDEGHLASLTMTLNSYGATRRNLDALFAMDNPRNRYKQITDESWALIQHGRIREGMTREECRLALGAPNEHIQYPTTSGMAERWTYDGGVYLIFEDGFLTRF